MNLQNKTIVVTGVASGIGAEVARLARFHGAKVIGVDRAPVQMTLHGFHQADLGAPVSIDALVKALPDHIDALANIAGVPGTAPPEVVARVNYLGLRHLTQGLLPRIVSGGSIINVASILGAEWPQRLDLHKQLAATDSFESGSAWLAAHPVPHDTCYQYFKEALIVWTLLQSWPWFADHGVRVNNVSPGPVFTPILGDFAAMLGEERVKADAKQAQRAWAATSPRERAAVFYRAAQAMQARGAQATLLIARETGGILPKAQREVDESVVFYQQAAGMPLQASGQMLPTSSGQLSLARRLPLGLIGVISPFNFPLILSLRSVAPAQAMGNAVILKPDPRTPYTGGVIIAQVLEEAGLPKGLLHVLHGDAQIGRALVESPDVPMIAFTGSTAADRRIGEIAGRHLKKVSLELGGNNAVIVLDDTDLDKAASAVAFGAYMHQGQICMATGRVLVQRGVAQALTQRLAEKARHLPVGDPVSGTVALGPIIDQRQLQRVIDIVSDSVAAGAVVEAGATNEGLFYAPTVLSNVRPGMRVFDEEVFGPVITSPCSTPMTKPLSWPTRASTGWRQASCRHRFRGHWRWARSCTPACCISTIRRWPMRSSIRSVALVRRAMAPASAASPIGSSTPTGNG